MDFSLNHTNTSPKPVEGGIAGDISICPIQILLRTFSGRARSEQFKREFKSIPTSVIRRYFAKLGLSWPFFYGLSLCGKINSRTKQNESKKELLEWLGYAITRLS